MEPGNNNLDKWREYFRSSSCDIFDIIEQAILVAACDCPKEFRLRRDRIAETLFSSKLIKCVGCDHVELCVKKDCDADAAAAEIKIGGGGEVEAGRSKESKVDSGSRGDYDDDDDDDDHGCEMNHQMISHYTYNDAEALTDEIDKQSQIHGEVMRIKKVLENSEDEPISSLLDSLKRLELMVLSVDILKATEIGKTVNVLRKHGSRDIRLLARTLIESWKLLVDEWANSTANAADAPDGNTPESMNPSAVVDEENGLPSPPLDDLSFFATQPTTMELSQFFDGLEDEENPGHFAGIKENKEIGRNHPVESCRTVKQRPRLPVESITPPNDKKNEQIKKPDALQKKQVTLQKPKLPVADTRADRPTKPSLNQRINAETKLQQKSAKDATQKPPQKSEKDAIQRPPVSKQSKPRCSDEASVQVKLEATKRKLQERYQQAENAKKQRTIQVMDLHDLPKQGRDHKHPPVKPGNNHKSGNNHRRHWANRRR